MTELSEYKLSKRELFLFYSGIAVCGVLLAYLFYRNILFAFVIIPFSGRIKKYVVDALIEKRRQEYRIQFKDFLFMAATAIGAGRSMKDAIGEAIPGLIEIYGPKAILVHELSLVFERLEFGGENDVDVLMELALASEMDDVIDFVNVYSICKTSGANMILALNKAASVIIDKMTIDKEIKELVKRKEAEGLIIFVMPILVILFLNLCAPDYIAPLYESSTGRILMTVCIASEIAIYELIQNIIHVEI